MKKPLVRLKDWLCSCIKEGKCSKAELKKLLVDFFQSLRDIRAVYEHLMAQSVGKEVLESIFQKISEQLKSEKTLDAERLLNHVYNELMRDGKDQTVLDAFRAHYGRLIDLLVGHGGGHAWLQ